MKKAILLTSIIASMTTMANVTGFVEGNGDGEVRFNKTLDGKTFVDGDIKDLSVKGEVKVDRFTLGAILKNKDIKEISKVKPLTTEMYTENLLDNSSVYAKYELPEFAGIKSYVKGTLNPKAKYEADGTLNFKKGNVELEGQLAHSFSNGTEVSLTSNTTFPFEKKDGEYGKAASSEHTLKLGAKKLNNFEDLEASLTIGHVYAKDGFRKAELNTKGTYVGLKDTKLNGEFNFIDEKEDDGKTDKNMAVSLKAGANYKGVKDLELDGKFNFKYQVKGTSKVKDIITDSDIVLNKDAYAHSYELDAKYTGVKDLELTAGAFVQHIHFDEGGYANYATKPLEELYALNGIADNMISTYLDGLPKVKSDILLAEKRVQEMTPEEIQNAKKAKEEFEKIVEDFKEGINKEFEKDLKEYNNEVDKEKAKKVFDKQTRICELKKELKELRFEKYALNIFVMKVPRNRINDVNAKKNIEYILKEIKIIDEEIAKKTAEKTSLESEVRTLNVESAEYLALAKFKKENFDMEKFKSSTMKVKKNAQGKYEPDNNNGTEVYKYWNTYRNTAYGQLEEMKNRADIQDSYNKFVKNISRFKAKLDLVNFGAKLGAKYTGVKNLTLTADGVFAGRYHSKYNQLLKFPAYTTGYVKLHAGAKYDFKLLNDKLVVSPEGNITATFADIYAGICDPSLVLAPKVSLEYKPIEELKVKGSIEVPVKFGLNEFREFGYKNTSIKGTLNMRYEWK